MDVAFSLNEKDFFDPYKGILSVKSCNFTNFSAAFIAGNNSILSIELSSITNCRQAGIICDNPKLLKVSGTIIENIEGNGIEITFSNVKEVSPIYIRETAKKVHIEDNRFQGCKDCGILIKGQVSSSLDQNEID